MGVVEGLSATIAQHNPEVDFQTVWASDGEEAKLDIYYREAITDLENFLARFSSSTTQQFDLQALADDFTITIKTLASWPPRLSGVLTNQIQNYLVHAILAGWLSDFPDMNHTDYASMGASDLEAIKEVLLKKDFSFAEAERTADDMQQGENDNSAEQDQDRIDHSGKNALPRTLFDFCPLFCPFHYQRLTSLTRLLILLNTMMTMKLMTELNRPTAAEKLYSPPSNARRYT